MTTIALVTLLGCAAWAVTAGLLTVRYCQLRGTSINPLLLGIGMLRCLGRYRELTVAETGHVGVLFYHFIIAINAALLAAIVLLLVKIM